MHFPHGKYLNFSLNLLTTIVTQTYKELHLQQDTFWEVVKLDICLRLHFLGAMQKKIGNVCQKQLSYGYGYYSASNEFQTEIVST